MASELTDMGSVTDASRYATVIPSQDDGKGMQHGTYNLAADDQNYLPQDANHLP